MDQTEHTTQTESQATTNEQNEQTQSVTPALFDEQQDNSQNSTENQQDNQSSDPNQDNQENQNQSQQLTEQDIKIPEGFTYDKEVGASFLGIEFLGNSERREIITQGISAEINRFISRSKCENA